MRHAKSDWGAETTTDHERPLNQRGRREAPVVGERIREAGWVPDLIAASDSKRTTETAEAILQWFPETRVSFHRELYLAGRHQLAKLAPRFEAARTLLVLGHNPGWEDMVSDLSGEPTEMKTAYAALLSVHAPTVAAGLAMLGKWKLVRLLTP